MSLPAGLVEQAKEAVAEERAIAIVARALKHHDPLLVPAWVVARAWRDGTRQARLARLLGAHSANSADVVDASVAVAARQRGARVLTSDPEDLQRLDRHLDVVPV